MSDASRAIRWRLALVVAGAVVVILMYFAGGRNEPYVIRINFGMDPARLEGTEVVIDGEVAGTLQRMGARTETGFRVGEGTHRVTLRHPELPSDTAEITTGFGGGTVMLLIDFGRRTVGDSIRTFLTLQP